MKYLLLDISGIIYRAFFALNADKFRRSDGFPTNAIYGTINIIKQLNKKFPDYIFIACCDCKRSELHRSTADPTYKKNREDKHPTLVQQFEYIYKSIQSMNITSVKKIGYEADDIIASLCKQLTDDEIIVATSDKDMIQLLVYDNVQIYNPKTKDYMTTEYCIDKYKVKPEQFTFYQALVGDASDNIKGIKGVGPKTASKLVNEFNTIDNFTHNCSEKYRNHLKDFNNSLELVSLNTEIEIEKKFSKQNLKTTEFKEFCKSMEIK